jgi:hypothetical protein
MNPILKVNKLSKFRHFKLLSIFDLLSILFQCIVQPFRGNFAIVSDANYLSLKKMFLLTFEFRVTFNSFIEISTKDMLDEFRCA